MTVVAELAVNTVILTEGMNAGVQRAKSEMGELAGFMGRSGAAIGVAGGIVAGTLALVNDRAGQMDELVNGSERLGVFTGDLQALRYAAGQTSDMVGNELDANLARLGQGISAAAHGTGKAREGLNLLHLDARKLATLPVDQQMFRIADAMKSVGTESERLEIAKRMGVDDKFVNMLGKGSGEIKGLMDRAREMGLVLDETRARSLAGTNDAIDEMKTALSAAGTEIAASFSPAVEAGANAVSGLLTGIRNLAQEATFKVMGADSDDVRQSERQQLEYQRQRKADEIAYERRQAMNLAERRRSEASAAAEKAAAEKKYYEETQAAQDRLADRIGENQRRIRQFNMTPTQQAKDDIEHDHTVGPLAKNILARQQDTIERLAKAREANNAALERQRDLESEATQLVREQMTPLDQLEEKLGRINEMYEAGTLSQSQALTAAHDARGDFSAANVADAGPRRGANVAIKLGSVEAFRLARDNKNSQTPEKHLKASEKANELLAKIEQKLDVGVAAAAPVANWN